MAKTKATRKRNLTVADKAAAARLKQLWLAAVAARRDTSEPLTQNLVADRLEHYTKRGSQGAISQYINGGIALNYKAVLAFADVIGCAPTDIRNDLAEFRGKEERMSRPAKGELDALWFAVGTVAAVITSKRLDEGERIASALEAAMANFQEKDQLAELVNSLRKGAEKARKGRRAAAS
jgi:UDP-N-acetylmuramyl pentapeptide synthase